MEFRASPGKSHGTNSNTSNRQQPGDARVAGKLPVPALVRALRAGNQAEFKRFLRQRANTNEFDPNTGKSALHVAIERGDVMSILLLLTHGAKPHLHTGSFPSAVEFLLKNSIVHPSGEYSAERQHDLKQQIFSALVEAGGPPDLKVDGTPLIIWCVWEDWDDSLARLLGHGADPDKRDGDNWTALAHAIGRRRETAARMLVAAGADVNARIGLPNARYTLRELAHTVNAEDLLPQA